MKDSAIMPHIVSRGVQFDLRDIRDQPEDALRRRTESPSVRIDCRLRDVEDSYVPISTGE
jgi:hypothetical protein